MSTNVEKVIIFGLQDFASLAHFYLKQDDAFQVIGFTAHEKYLEGTSSFEGLSTVAFEEIEKKYPVDTFRIFAPMSYRNMNRVRSAVYGEIQNKGYKMISYVHPTSVIATGISIGENCFILENNVIQPFVSLGNNVVLWSGNQISHHSSIGDHVFLGSQVAISGHSEIEPYSFLGIHSTVRENVRISEGTLVGMGALVTGDTEAWSIYQGIPAKKMLGSSKNFTV